MVLSQLWVALSFFDFSRIMKIFYLKIIFREKRIKKRRKTFFVCGATHSHKKPILFQPKHNESSNEWLLSGEPVVEANNSDGDASITSSIVEENSKYFQRGESTGVSKNPKIKMNFPKKRGFPMPRRSIMSSEEKTKRLRCIFELHVKTHGFSTN